MPPIESLPPLGLVTLAAIAALVLFSLAAVSFVTDPAIVTPVDTQARLLTGAQKTATYNGTAVDLGDGFAPSHGGLPVQTSFNVTERDATTGNETYTAVLEDSADNSSFAAIGPTVTISAVGSVKLHGKVARRYVRVTLTLGGTTPIITYGDAYLSKSPH